MAAMVMKSSSIELGSLALERAVEQFRTRAVAEFWRLQDRLPQSAPLEPADQDHARPTSVEAWDRARRQHHLARQGMIPWPAGKTPPTRAVSVLRHEHWGPDPSGWSSKPRAA